jgi:hypothetical protein
MSHKVETELSLADPYALERERSTRDAPKPEGNEAVWDDFARWMAQSTPPKTSVSTVGSGSANVSTAMRKLAQTTPRSKKPPIASLQHSHDRERERMLKTNITDHQIRRGRSSNGKSRSLLFWVPIVAAFAWFWFGRG